VVQKTGGRPARMFAYRLQSREMGAPSASYLEVIWKAYREWNFDASALAEAIEEGCRGKEHLRGAREIALSIMGRSGSC
jgi:hypothetical protein